MSHSVISSRIAAAQKCLELGAFRALHPVYGRKLGNLVLELARLDRGGRSIWVAPDALALRLGVSRATFYRLLSVAMELRLVTSRGRSRVGTRLQVNWLALGPVFNAALRAADAVRMKCGRYLNRVRVAGEALQRMVKAGFQVDPLGSSHGELTISQEKRKTEEKAPSGPASVALTVADYLALCADRARGRANLG